MGRFWNLKTKFVSVLVLILFGSFVVQKYVHSVNERRLLDEVVQVSQDLANEVTGKLEERQVNVSILDSSGSVSESKQLAAPAILRRFHFDRVYEDGKHFLKIRIPGLDGADRRRIAEFINQARQELLEQHARSQDRASRQFADAKEQSILNLQRGMPGTNRRSPIGRSEDDMLFPDPQLGAEALRPDQDKTARSDSAAIAPQPTPNVRVMFLAPTESTTDAAINIEPYAERFQAMFASYRSHDLMATVGVFLMGIGLAWILGVRMTRPIYQVMDGFHKVANGNLEVTVPEKGGSELGLLGAQFNRMVGRLRENRQIERELEQRERIQLMGDLAAGVAHDVRNPLNAIHLNVDQIREEFQPADELSRERFLRFTADVQQEVTRLNQLVTNFLSLARPTTEDRVACDANEMFRDLLRLLEKEAKGRNVNIELDLATPLPLVLWNRQEVMSAFLNLAMNGFQAMEPDGGSLTLRTRALLRGDDHEIVISIHDTGKGIAAEHLDKIFIPYFTTRKGGTGLGMAIARRVAERNGGSIEISSQLGEGTTVTCVFPGLRGEEITA